MATRLTYFNEAKQHLHLIEMVITKFGALYKGLFDVEYLKELINCLLNAGFTKAAEEIAEKKGKAGRSNKQKILGLVEAELSDVRNSLGFDFSITDGIEDDEAKRMIKAVHSELQKHLYSSSLGLVQRLQSIDGRQLGKKITKPFHEISEVRLSRMFEELKKKGIKGSLEDFIKFVNLKEPKSNIVFKSVEQAAAALSAIYFESKMDVPWAQYCKIQKVGYGKHAIAFNSDSLSNAASNLRESSLENEETVLIRKAKVLYQSMNPY